MSPVPAGEAVQWWTVLPNGLVEVCTNKGTYTAEKLVLAGGAWMDQLVPELKVRTPLGNSTASAQLLWLQYALTEFGSMFGLVMP
jgi:glycine/D-amino acid oxidase-like deaminating enzyme